MPDMPYADLTLDEMRAIAFYLDRAQYDTGLSVATKEEIRGLIERVKSIAAELAANAGEDVD